MLWFSCFARVKTIQKSPLDIRHRCLCMLMLCLLQHPLPWRPPIVANCEHFVCLCVRSYIHPHTFSFFFMVFAIQSLSLMWYVLSFVCNSACRSWLPPLALYFFPSLCVSFRPSSLWFFFHFIFEKCIASFSFLPCVRFSCVYGSEVIIGTLSRNQKRTERSEMRANQQCVLENQFL